MKWPAMVRFENSDELELIESQQYWELFLQTAAVDCQLILSDGTLHNITVNRHGSQICSVSAEIMDVDTAVELARTHMAAQAHCCVSKFYAPTVEAVILALLQLDD